MQAFYPVGSKIGTQRALHKEGFLNCHTAVIAGKPTFVFFWYQTFDRGMMITGCACLLDGKPRFDDAVGCAIHLAKINEMNHIIFHSMRAGMCRQAVKRGFIPQAVCYRKTL